MEGQGFLRWKEDRAELLRWIRPLELRAQLVQRTLGVAFAWRGAVERVDLVEWAWPPDLPPLLLAVAGVLQQ